MGMARRSAADWQEIVDDWQASGVSSREYGDSRGLNARTLTWWKWKLSSTARPRFVEVVVSEPAPDLVVDLGEVLVRVPRGFDAAELRRLVGALC